MEHARDRVRRGWLLRQWYRLARQMRAALAILRMPAFRLALAWVAPGLSTSTSGPTAPATRDPTTRSLTQLNKRELLTIAVLYQLEVNEDMTVPELREAIREVRGDLRQETRYADPRLKGYCKKNKPELIQLCEELGLSTTGTVDALRLRLKQWNQAGGRAQASSRSSGAASAPSAGSSQPRPTTTTAKAAARPSQRPEPLPEEDEESISDAILGSVTGSEALSDEDLPSVAAGHSEASFRMIYNNADRPGQMISRLLEEPQ